MEVKELRDDEKRASAIHRWNGFTLSHGNKRRGTGSVTFIQTAYQEVEGKGLGAPFPKSLSKPSQPGTQELSGFIAPLSSALASSTSAVESHGEGQKRKGADVQDSEHLKKKPKWHQEVAGQHCGEELLSNPNQPGVHKANGSIACLSSVLASSVSADHFQKRSDKCKIFSVKARGVAIQRKSDPEESQHLQNKDARQDNDPSEPIVTLPLSYKPLPKWPSSLFTDEADSKKSGESNSLQVAQKRKSPRQQVSGHLQKKSKQLIALQAQEELQPSTSYGRPDQSISKGLPYTEGPKLGEGGFGSVYASTRISDGLPVALKYVSKDRVDEELDLDGQGLVPIEVALMKQVNSGLACPNILQLVEWLEEPRHYVMVLERPEPCQDLSRFCEENGNLDENLAKRVMVQLIKALKHCESRRVLHRDVKPQNILINTDTHDIKLLDFGCGDVLKSSAYRSFAGTFEFAPPEWFLFRQYHAGPATVWSLGVTLYNLLCGKLPFRTRRNIIKGKLRLPKNLSIACRRLISWCLRANPDDRPTLQDIEHHPWFQ